MALLISKLPSTGYPTQGVPGEVRLIAFLLVALEVDARTSEGAEGVRVAHPRGVSDQAAEGLGG